MQEKFGERHGQKSFERALQRPRAEAFVKPPFGEKFFGFRRIQRDLVV
jgi:hypothetical protein